jgi:murein DD-endopeptidase MepM/ murein hydrolase activator NlpD
MKFILWLTRKFSIELKIVIVTIFILLSLPIITVTILSVSGFAAASQALASINPVTKLVEIFDANGNKVREIELSTAWPATGYVSDEFGTLDTIRRLLGLGRHTGIDIANERGLSGTPVTTFLVGTVVMVDPVDDSACGKSVKVDHGNGIQSLYCHLDSTATSVNRPVKPGDLIGYMGNTGASTGPHLHFQISVYGIPVNPRTFMVGEPRGTY